MKKLSKSTQKVHKEKIDGPPRSVMGFFAAAVGNPNSSI